jgi:serine/threonine protein kinase
MFSARAALTLPIELQRLDVTLGDVLGSGQFGEVRAGRLTSVMGRIRTKTAVAVKIIREQDDPDATAIARTAFMEEAAVVWQFVHVNVVRTYGVVTSRSPHLLVMELCERGELRDYVANQTSDPGALLDILHGVTVGMAFVGTMGVVHRDLAARNVLLDKNRVPKIADFGLGRCVGDAYYRAARDTALPLRWTDPW